jgi:hypothetical protein
MDLELVLQRVPHAMAHLRTPGELYLNGVLVCFTVEDPVRELAGVPVSQWKIPGATAIPAARSLVTLENSPRFGPDTITIHAVEGFSGVRIHGGNDEGDTEGCPLVGCALTPEGTIVGGMSRPALEILKRNIRRYLSKGGRVFIDVRNP